MASVDKPAASFLARHEFLIRRLHSLSGLVPLGAYVIVHLVVNASVVEGVGTFQNNVLKIHSLGGLLPFVEWTFIFIPLIFHTVIGLAIIRGSLPNSGSYPYAENVRYTLQRVTAMILLFFIFWHVFHMHGWFHWEWWQEGVADKLGGHKFRAYNAASTAGLALQNLFITAIYFVGVVATVFHLANGLWTFGITWGIWTSPSAQKRAWKVCAGFGIILLVVGLGALFGMRKVAENPRRLEEAQSIEKNIVDEAIKRGDIKENEHKRFQPVKADENKTASRTLPRPK